MSDNGRDCPSSSLTLDKVLGMVAQFGPRKHDPPPIEFVYEVLEKVDAILKEEPNIVRLPAPTDTEKVTCIGDLHGQFYDGLAKVLKLAGDPGSNPGSFLFLGDYVDRGPCSIEVVTILFALKALFPSRVFLLRGNHECRAVTVIHGFAHELIDKYKPHADAKALWEKIMTVFDRLPIAAIVGEKVFVCHGGIPLSATGDIVLLSEVDSLDRVKEPPASGPMTSILWNDPFDGQGVASNDRGIGHTFGLDVIEKFLHANGLTWMIRSHQMAANGVMYHGKCVTVFSAPRYSGRMTNKGAIVTLGGDLTPHAVIFEYEAPPDVC